MKTVFTRLSGLLLVMCLVLYGPFATAGVGAVFSMEICADGVAKTVHLDANGTPVEPTQDCCDCLTCGHITGAEPRVPLGESPSLVLLEIGATRTSPQGTFFQKRNIRPMPHGPPVLKPSTQTTSGCKDTRGGGRPMFKDANA